MAYEGIENKLNASMYAGAGAKAHTDKLLAVEEIEEIKDIIQCDRLKSQDLRKLVYLLGAVEIKLVNFDVKDRYILGKYLTWIRRTITLLDMHLKYIKSLEGKKISKATEEANEMVYSIWDEDTKYLCDIYLYLTRSSLSLNGVAFDTLNKSRFEYEYNQPGTTTNDPKSVFNIRGQ